MLGTIISCFCHTVKRRKSATAVAAALYCLLLTERLAVRALVHGGVCFVSAHHDAVQRAVVLGIAMVSALLNGAFDALVCVTIHDFQPPFFEFAVSMRTLPKKQSWLNLEIIC